MVLDNTEVHVLLSSVRRDTLKKWYHEGMDSKLLTQFDEELGETVFSFSGKYHLTSDHLIYPNSQRIFPDPYPELTHSNLHFIVKVDNDPFDIELAVQDSKNEDRVFRLRNKIELITPGAMMCILPLPLMNTSWTQFSLDLNRMVNSSYDTKYMKLKMLHFSTTCKIRKIFMTKADQFSLRMLLNPRQPLSKSPYPKPYVMDKYKMNRAAGFRIGNAGQNKKDEDTDKTAQVKKGEFPPLKNKPAKIKTAIKEKALSKEKPETNKEVLNKDKSKPAIRSAKNVVKEPKNVVKEPQMKSTAIQTIQKSVDKIEKQKLIVGRQNKTASYETSHSKLVTPENINTKGNDENQKINTKANDENQKIKIKPSNEDQKVSTEKQNISTNPSNENLKAILEVKNEEVSLENDEREHKNMDRSSQDLEAIHKVNHSGSKTVNNIENKIDKCVSNEELDVSRGMIENVQEKNIDECVENYMRSRLDDNKPFKQTPTPVVPPVEENKKIAEIKPEPMKPVLKGKILQSSSPENSIVEKTEEILKKPQSSSPENSTSEKLEQVIKTTLMKPHSSSLENNTVEKKVIKTIPKKPNIVKKKVPINKSRSKGNSSKRVTKSGNKIDVEKTKTTTDHLISETSSKTAEVTKKQIQGRSSGTSKPRKEVTRHKLLQEPRISNVDRFSKSLEKYDYI